MASSISAGTTSGTALVHTADTTGALQLATNNGTVAVTINTSQNVGIGTSSPDTILNIQGVDPTFLIQDSDEAGDGFIKFQTANGTQRAFIQAAMTANVMLLGTGTSEAMRIDSGGRVLINKTSNNGTSLVQMTSPASTDIILAQIGTNGLSAMAFLNAGGAAQVGSIVVNVSSTAYNTSSDYRLKEAIAPMTGALAKVALLKPCTYKWKVDGSEGQGFIAHELDEVVSGCVTGEKDAVDEDGNPRYQGIDTSFLVATLTAAIQEQQALITQQAAAIEALTTRITALEGTPA